MEVKKNVVGQEEMEINSCKHKTRRMKNGVNKTIMKVVKYKEAKRKYSKKNSNIRNKTLE